MPWKCNCFPTRPTTFKGRLYALLCSRAGHCLSKGGHGGGATSFIKEPALLVLLSLQPEAEKQSELLCPVPSWRYLDCPHGGSIALVRECLSPSTRNGHCLARRQGPAWAAGRWTPAFLPHSAIRTSVIHSLTYSFISFFPHWEPRIESRLFVGALQMCWG